MEQKLLFVCYYISIVYRHYNEVTLTRLCKVPVSIWIPKRRCMQLLLVCMRNVPYLYTHAHTSLYKATVWWSCWPRGQKAVLCITHGALSRHHESCWQIHFGDPADGTVSCPRVMVWATWASPISSWTIASPVINRYPARLDLSKCHQSWLGTEHWRTNINTFYLLFVYSLFFLWSEAQYLYIHFINSATTPFKLPLHCHSI